MDGYWHNNTTAGSALLRKPILLLFITVMMNTLFKVVNSPEEIEEKTKAAFLAVEAKFFLVLHVHQVYFEASNIKSGSNRLAHIDTKLCSGMFEAILVLFSWNI